ncbi:MAG TPA: hypothetical protein VK400_20680 [Pyrinomonadaceae bacterium]|nr:hypothetical protein [Pyrinomonadaceae bacterium]
MKAEDRLSFLPGIEELRKLSQSLALLDAILSPEWEYRFFSFNSKWGDAETMASMRDGCGNDYFILFNSAGAIIKGFEHESVMSPYASEPKKIWAGVLDSVPKEFAGFLSEPAFNIADTTFCLWRRYADSCWQIGEIDYPDDENPDGLEDLLFALDGNPLTYKNFAEEYYEQEIPISSVESVYRHEPLSDELVKTLNENVSIGDLREDIEEIGYPMPPK